MGQAALKAILQRDGKRPTDQPSQAMWGDAIRNVEGVIGHLTSDAVKANVIVNTHIMYQSDDNGGAKAYPSALGNKLPSYISRYFNTVMRLDVKVGGKEGSTRTLRTSSDFKMALKNTAPNVIPIEAEPDLTKLILTIRENAKRLQAPKGSA